MEGFIEDGELVRRARNGDTAAFDELVARHGRLVLSLARKIVRNRTEAEDIAQETFLRFFRSLDRLDPARPLEPWLVRLTVNAARSQVTRRPQRREEQLPEERELSPGRGDPAVSLQNTQLRQALQAAIETLPERERLVFLLRDQEGLDAGTIAEALGVADVTIRRQSMEARRKVAAWFRQHRPELIP